VPSKKVLTTLRADTLHSLKVGKSHLEVLEMKADESLFLDSCDYFSGTGFAGKIKILYPAIGERLAGRGPFLRICPGHHS
jgi:hypothetical protein